MNTLGVREARADLAAIVRRAGAGEPTVIDVRGVPMAVLAPLTHLAPALPDAQASDAARLTWAALVAGGGLIPPRRHDGRTAPLAVPVWGTVRFDRLLREIRG
jgi:prevent-host-death family protein